ncbi:MAG: sensor histidine kinase, partial [Candidatus Nitrosocosmicus sp.]
NNNLVSIVVENNPNNVHSKYTKFSNKYNEKTIIVHGEEKTTKLILKTIYNSKNRWDVYANSKGPTISMGVSSIRKGMEDAYERGIKIRYISEITKHNIQYCKELMKIAEMRHLDGTKGGMAVNETEYIATAHLQEAKPVLHLIHSNVKEIVEQQQLVFESFWIRAIPAEQKIREIEEGTEPVKTKVLEYSGDIYNHLINTIKKSSGCYVCFSIGGMRMIYNNFFNSLKGIIQSQEKERKEREGIKWLTHIDGHKNNIELVKTFLNAGIQIRHIKNLPSINFSVETNSIQATIERMDDGKIMNSLLVSNESAYIKHFMSFFQDLWTNSGIDAVERIKSIEEGLEYDNEIIRQSDRAFDSYLDIVKMAQNEILFIFPTPKAFIRQLKAIYLAIEVSKERKAKVRVLTPSNDLVEKSIKLLLKYKGKEKDAQEEENEKEEEEDTNHTITSFSKNEGDIKIRFIEKMSNTKATIVVVDRKESLVMELKDDTKDTFIEAIGLTTYSNSKSAVLSYIAIFENLWKQSELYQEIKKSHKNLRMANKQLKIKDETLNEFIQIAAHELKNPIQPILSLSQHVRANLEQENKPRMSKDEILRILDVVIRNAKKLHQLSDDILDIGKIETNSLYLKKEIFDLKELLQGLVDDFKSQVQQQHNSCNIVFHSKIEEHLQKQSQQQKPSLYIVIADKARIIQVVSNILNNAIKFTNNDGGNSGDGLIQIIIDKKDINCDKSDIIVSIKDAGSGIDNEIYPKLFSKFVSKSTQGTGLGLYISKNIIESHGGKIWAHNNKDGRGATFAFSLNGYI